MMVSIGIGGCLRIGEIVSLTIGQVFVNGKVKSSFFLSPTQSKSGKSGQVFLTGKTQKKLTDYLSKMDTSDLSSPLFPSQKRNTNNGFMTANYGSQLISKLMKRAGLGDDYSAHSLRHTLPTYAVKNQSMSVATISKMLRHHSIAVTSRYIHLLNTDVEKSIASIPL